LGTELWVYDSFLFPFWLCIQFGIHTIIVRDITSSDFINSHWFYKLFNYWSQMYFFQGATAPSGPGPPHCRVFTITLRHTTLVRLLWTSDQPYAESSTCQHTTLTTDRNECPRRDSTSKWEAKDPRLRPRGHWDWHILQKGDQNVFDTNSRKQFI
jgi:hypothetical protein